MKITNHYNLPEPIIKAAENDEYDRGDSVMSVTQLISSPRIVLLQNLNADNISQDVTDRIPSMLGTAFHKILERGAEGLPGHILEERMFLDVHGWRISGAVDLQINHGDHWEINDYKVTSVYSVMSEKPEWERQLNCYAYLAYSVHGRVVKKLKIVAILRDWQRKQAGLKPEYPESHVVVVDIPVWTREVQEAFIRGRVALHQYAKKLVDSGEPLLYCTEEETWLRGEVWALMRRGRKSAVRLYEDRDEAEAAREKSGSDHYIEHRPGTRIRCEGNYCLVAQYCKQWRSESGRGSGQGSG